MKIQLAPNIPLAIVLFAAVAVIALRTAARRLEPRRAPGTEPGQAAVTANRTRPRSAVTTTQGQPAGAVEDPAGISRTARRWAQCSLCRLRRHVRVGVMPRPRNDIDVPAMSFGHDV